MNFQWERKGAGLVGWRRYSLLMQNQRQKRFIYTTVSFHFCLFPNKNFGWSFLVLFFIVCNYSVVLSRNQEGGDGFLEDWSLSNTTLHFQHHRNHCIKQRRSKESMFWMLPLRQLLQLRLQLLLPMQQLRSSVLQLPLTLSIISQQGIGTGLLLRSKVLSGHIWWAYLWNLYPLLPKLTLLMLNLLL